MGALLVASVSSFTSCKDYDDDINDLRSQINGLNTSLSATIADKEAALSKSITTLTEQLAAVKTDYAKADEALQAALNKVESDLKGSIEANKTNISSNLTAINDLKQEVVNLKAADTNLQKAIDALQAGQNEANALIKSQGESILGLAAADLALEKAINAAQAQADNALAEAQKAQTAAATNAANLATTNSDVANLQKTVEKNLSDVNAKIAEVQTALEGRIKTNEGNIAELQKKVAANEANITTATTKLGELAAKDAEIESALNTAKETLAGQIAAGDKAQADALTAQVEKLQTQITANKEAIALFNQQTLTELRNDLKTLEETLKKHDIPEAVAAEVAKQIPDALKDYMKSDDINKLINDENLARVSAIEALQKKAKQDSIDLAQYSEGLALLTAAYLVPEGVDFDKINAPAEASVTALVLAGAIKAADQKISDEIETVVKPAIEDMKNAEKEGSLANLIAKMNDADVATSLAGKIAALKQSFEKATDASDPNSLAGRFETIESFFAPAEAGQEVSVDNLAAKIAQTEAFTGAVADAANEANGEILDMITSINLYANLHQAISDEEMGESYTQDKIYKKLGYNNFDHTLTFPYAIELGKPNKDKWEFPADYEFLGNYLVDGNFTFEKGMYRSYSDSILVRVNPVNAKLTKENITLLNSQAQDLVAAGLIEVDSVCKFNKMITRAATETGLWVIYFKLQEKVTTDFNKYAYATTNKVVTASGVTEYQKKIVYAVAVKNTKSNEGDTERYVVSEYDLDLAQAQAMHDDRFFVNNVIIDSIHNRYIQTDESPNEVGSIWTDDKKDNAGTYRKELVWKTFCDEEKNKPDYGIVEDPEVSKVTIFDYYCDCWRNPDNNEWLGGNCDENNVDNNGKSHQSMLAFTYVAWDEANEGWIGDKTEEELCDYNAVNRLGHVLSADKRGTSGLDNRHNKPKLELDFGTAQEITIPIDFLDFNECGDPTPIKGFYVTLDQDFALESNNSEVNAWTSYEYENVGYYRVNEGKLVEGSQVAAKLQKGNHGYIKIFRKNNVKSDIIGFRVYAVNLDGTLVDPDGRAFYVTFGKAIVDHALAFNVLVEDKTIDGKNVQNGPNPIKAFNADPENSSKFFNIPVTNASFNPNHKYEVEYTWREDNEGVIRGSAITAVAPHTPVANTPDETTYLKSDGTIGKTKGSIKITDIFNFEFSENGDADAKDKTNGTDNKWAAFNGTITTDLNDIKPNAKTNSVRATINKAYFNRLVDNETYKILMTIKRVDEATGTTVVVNRTSIDITKVMPTSLPTAFSVKSLQLEAPVNFYVRPEGPAGAAAAVDPWKITWGTDNNDWEHNNFASNLVAGQVWNATTEKYDDPAAQDEWHAYRWANDVRPYAFEEFFNGILVDKVQSGGSTTKEFDKDYYFEFYGTGSKRDAEVAYDETTKKGYKTYAAGDEAEKNSVGVAEFDTDWSNAWSQSSTSRVSGYHVPPIHYSHVGEDKTFDVKVGYIFRGISATIDPKTGNFYKPEGKDINGTASNIQNQDLKIASQETKPKFQAKFLCALDAAAPLKEKVFAPNDKLKNVVHVTNIAYEDGALKWLKFKAGTGKTAIEGADLADAAQVVSTDYMIFKMANNWFGTNVNGQNTYFDTKFKSDFKNVEKKLTDLLQERYLVIEDLDYSTIKINNFYSGYNATTGQPSGTKLDYKPEDYFTWYYATTTGSQATKSDEVAGIKFVPTYRSAQTPNLTKDVYAEITFPVYDVWHHERTNVKLYVKFAKPLTSASRQGR